MKGQKNSISSTGFPADHELNLLGHELGNVLNGLLGMAELLAGSGLDANQERLLRAMVQSGRQMQSLIRSCRMVQGGAGLDIVPRISRMDGVELLEQVVISHTPAAVQANIRLLLVTDSGLPRHWHSDSCLVRQLLDNLVGNAIKFTAVGQVVIEAAVVADAGGTLRLRISDTGPGIGETSGQRIFEAYQREHEPPASGPGNTGLGLYLCHQIVQAMKGSIFCLQPKGGGACFEISLPGTLVAGEESPRVLRSSLFAQIRVQLELENTLGRSVRGFLDRLGVRWRRPAGKKNEHELLLVISTTGGKAGNDPQCLLLTPAGLPLPGRVLEAPLLESSLGQLLLELALEWRSLGIRNEKPDSTPKRR